MNYPSIDMTYGQSKVYATTSGLLSIPRISDSPRRLLQHPFFKVPLEIELVYEDGYWLASSAGILTHGVGDSPEDAVDDYADMVIDLFRELTDSESVLAPHLLKELFNLRDIVSPAALLE